MCFTEFIGYTCGHTSLSVLRPCPLTTNIHTNPVCSSRGRRPILAEAMCPACQRILHGRAVLIMEWEHHWMHERGVCGCPVIFPDLVRPRVAGQSRTCPETQRFQSETNRKDKTNRGRKGKGKRGEQDVAATARSTLADAPGSVSNTLHSLSLDSLSHDESALLTEPLANTARTVSEDTDTSVKVRITSFYGAEWVDDHRQLHKSGSCKCTGDFSFYQTSNAYLGALGIGRDGIEQASLRGPCYSFNMNERVSQGGSAFATPQEQTVYQSSRLAHRFPYSRTGFEAQDILGGMRFGVTASPQNPGSQLQHIHTATDGGQAYHDYTHGSQPGYMHRYWANANLQVGT